MKTQKFILVTLGAQLVAVLSSNGGDAPIITPAADGREYKCHFFEFGVN